MVEQWLGTSQIIRDFECLKFGYDILSNKDLGRSCLSLSLREDLGHRVEDKVRQMKKGVSPVTRLCFLGGGGASLPPTFISFAGPEARI